MVDYKWIALSNTTLGVTMASLDANIVLIALPTIAKDLPGTSILELLWILLGYQLVTASVLVNFGRLSDIFGRVKLYNFGFVLFTLGSALCAFSWNGIVLILFRMVQALGSAFLFSNSAAIITDAFPIGERGRALGTNQVAIVVGSVFGLILGGYLTSTAGWRSIFWINVPIGLFAIIWSRHKLRELGVIDRRQRIDFKGNVTFVLGLAASLTAITLYSLASLELNQFLLLVCFGLAMFGLFIFIERRSEYPMFRLGLFRIRAFALGNFSIFLNALARGAVSLVLVFYLQGPTMGLNPLSAGIFLVPISASLAFFGPISGWLSDKFGHRILSVLGLAVSSIGFLLLTQIGPSVTFMELLPSLLLVGSGMGIFASPNRSSIMSSVPSEERGVASGISTTLVLVGTTFSLGLAFLVMSSAMSIADLEKIFLGSLSGGNQQIVGNFIRSIHTVFYLSIFFLLVAMVVYFLRSDNQLVQDSIPSVPLE